MRDGWVETTLDRVTECSWGNTETTKSKYVESGYLAYSASGADGFLDWFEHDRTAVVLSAIGAQCGKTWFAEGQWTSIKNTIWLKSDNSNLLDKYLFYLSNRDQFWQIRGQAQPFISLGDVKKTKVLLPPLPEQKRIVDLISSMDLYLESLRAALAKSISARKSALESQLESFNKTSPIFRLEELCAAGKSAIVDGPFGANLKREDYLEEGIPVLKIQNIKQDYVVIKKMDYVSEDKYQELRRHSFQKGDIVMTKLGDPLGLSAIVRGLDKGLIVADLVRIRPDKIDVEFLCIQLNSAKIQNYINRMQKGSTRPRVNLGMIREMPIVVPNENEINDFISVFGAWGEQNRKLEETIHSTEQLRSSLLSDLLSGRHEIPASYDKVMGAA